MAALSRDELVRALLARVRRFTVTLDREAVLAPEAPAQAAALMAGVPGPGRDRARAGRGAADPVRAHRRAGRPARGGAVRAPCRGRHGP